MNSFSGAKKPYASKVQIKHYRSSQWADYRRSVIKLDGGCCRSCGRSEADGIVLQVHHTAYFPGKAPWEYPYEVCKTLCKGCHAAEHGKIPPRFGWEYVGYDDLSGLNGVCECCGTSIRYVFLVQHANWPTMEVGTVCCDHLTSSEIATNFIESQLRYRDRLKRFVSSKRWVELPWGGKRIVQKRIVLEILPSDGAFKIRMDEIPGKLSYPTELDAQMKAFHAIESGKAKDYIQKEKRRRIDEYYFRSLESE